MILYLCEKCHKWQDVSIGVFLTNTWNNAMKSVPDAKIPEPVGQPCPNGCGMMVQVKPEDKIALFKQDVDIRVDGKAVVNPVEQLKYESLLKDAVKLINLYAEAAPWEDGLAATKDHLLRCIDNLKKQDESTDLFDIVSKFTQEHPGACNVTAQSEKDKMLATYHVDTHTWELSCWRPQRQSIPIGETKLKMDLQAMAKKHSIDLTKGWKVINHQYKY